MRDPSSLRLQRWDRDFVAYHIPSGDTHFFDVALGTALQLLCERPATTAALTAHVAERTGLADGPELRAHLAEALERLEESGVLVRSDTA